MFAIWVGTLVPIDRILVIVAPEGRESEAMLRLARVGYENVSGYLEGGIAAWQAAGEKVQTITSITPEAFAAAVNSGTSGRLVADVRRPGEFESGHVAGAANICLSSFSAGVPAAVDKNQPYYIHCAGGYRSMIAASLLMANGYTNFINVYGGWAKIKDTDVPVEIGSVVSLL